jgi:hypothetical protein
MGTKKLFLLKGLFHENVDKKYNFVHLSESSSETNLEIMDNDPPSSSQRPNQQRRTHLSDLSKSDVSKVSFTFLDEAKKDHQCVVSMYDLVGHTLPSSTEMSCFWCRHPFDTMPVGCPLYYNSQRIIKKMSSETSKEPCMIRENVSTHVYQKIKGNLDHIPVNEKDFYIVDGIFCSFPCCLSFIKDNKHKNPIYRDSEHLLRQMCQQIFGYSVHTPLSIVTAPSWRLLQAYGGHLSIQSFRKCFENTHYIKNNQIVHSLPNQKMVGFLFEKQITL